MIGIWIYGLSREHETLKPGAIFPVHRRSQYLPSRLAIGQIVGPTLACFKPLNPALLAQTWPPACTRTITIMFRYFPTNYVWNLSVDLAIEMGARIGEIEEMCAPLQEAAKQPDAAGSKAFRETWAKMADKLCGLAEEDEANDRMLSAGEKYNRAATYYLSCERLQAHGAPGRAELYQRFLHTFQRGIELSQENCKRVEIPYEGKHISGLLVRAEGVTGSAPILVQVNGLDSTKEMKYRVGLPAWLAKRGVSSLIIDQPGTGEALRLHNLTARFDSEHWASRVVDWLETRSDIDAKTGSQVMQTQCF